MKLDGPKRSEPATAGLRGKTVVITGAGSGIGHATALAFAAAGARIAACDIDQARLDALAKELGDRALIVRRVDVADRAAMAKFAAEVHALVPAADVVVNNAGVAVGGTFLDTTLDDWDWLLGINLRGVVHGCHFFVPAMVARGTGGQVINISSVFGLYAAPNTSAYVASKFAVLGLSKALRVELAEHDIGVTAICPGLIATAIMEDSRLAGGVSTRRSKLTAMFRKGAPPARVAAAILDAVHTNPEIRPVGRDGWALWAFTRVAPGLMARFGAQVAKRVS